MSVWIFYNADDEGFGSMFKICAQFDEYGFHDYRAVQEDHFIYKMSNDGLETFIQGKKIQFHEYPKVLYNRVNSGCLKTDFHVPLFKHFELLGVRIVNSIDAILKTTNKVWHFLELAKHGIPIPTTLSYCSEDIEAFSNPEQALTYPIIAKSVRGNKGSKVFRIHSEIMHKEMMGVLNHDVPYLYQEYIAQSHGVDMRVIVVNGKAVYSMIRKALDGSVCANLSKGGEGKIVTGTYPKAEDLACKIANVLGIEICGVDLLFKSEDEYVCCEVNNTPGFSKSIYDIARVEKYICDYLLSLLQSKVLKKNHEN